MLVNEYFELGGCFVGRLGRAIHMSGIWRYSIDREARINFKPHLPRVVEGLGGRSSFGATYRVAACVPTTSATGNAWPKLGDNLHQAILAPLAEFRKGRRSERSSKTLWWSKAKRVWRMVCAR